MKRNKKNANGDGSIRQRSDGKWELRITTGKDVNGKAIRKSFYGAKQSEVKLKYKEYLKSTEILLDKMMTVKEWAERWLNIYKKGKISYKSYYNYTLYLDSHIIKSIGTLLLDEVRPVHIEKLFKDKQNLSYSAKHHILIILRSMFKSAIKNKLCKIDPSADIVIIQEAKASPAIFSPDDITAILTAAQNHKYGFYIQALLYSGMRLGELLALRWVDVDFENDLIHIRGAVALSESGWIMKSTKTGKERYVGITDNYKEILLKEFKNKSGEFVLNGDNNGFLRLHQFDYRYRKFFKDSKLKYLSPHKCRHTYATSLVKGGADLRTVQALLGHTKINTTQIYTQVDSDMIKNGVNKLKF